MLHKKKSCVHFPFRHQGYIVRACRGPSFGASSHETAQDCQRQVINVHVVSLLKLCNVGSSDILLVSGQRNYFSLFVDRSCFYIRSKFIFGYEKVKQFILLYLGLKSTLPTYNALGSDPDKSFTNYPCCMEFSTSRKGHLKLDT